MVVPDLKTRYHWGYRESRQSTGVRATHEWIDEILRCDAIQGWYREAVEAWKENGNQPISVKEMMGFGMSSTLLYRAVAGLQSVLRKEGLPVTIIQYPFSRGPQRLHYREFQDYQTAIRRHALEVSYVVMFVGPPVQKAAQTPEGVAHAE